MKSMVRRRLPTGIQTFRTGSSRMNRFTGGTRRYRTGRDRVRPGHAHHDRGTGTGVGAAAPAVRLVDRRLTGSVSS